MTTLPALKSFKLTLPKAEGTVELEVERSALFVGANGSGKTRLGSWIESNAAQPEKVYRISAQKSLSMPDATTPKSIDKAEKDLWYGYQDVEDTRSSLVYRTRAKWQNKPAIYPLSDFDKLMVYLFSEQVEANAKYREIAKLTQERVEPLITKLDRVKEIWEKVLPHRELILGGLRLQTKVRGGTQAVYNASEMSDGERVIFYLIGQCLAAPQDGTIIIDEPELHLHKSVQAPLWAEVEKLRPDCLFIYLTHDVDFATAQISANKIWLRAYDGTIWDWQPLEGVEGLPEALLIEILGNRKPVVFVEGEDGSLDAALYRSLFPEFFVIPRGGCIQVIDSVKALRNSNQLHHLDVYGIVDRDRRTDEEVNALLLHNIFVLKVAEVENLFCTKELLAFASSKLARNVDEDFVKISKFVFKKLRDELEAQISQRTANEIKFRLNLFDSKVKGEAALQGELGRLVQDIDVASIYEANRKLFEEVVKRQSYDELLKYYNRKSIASQVSAELGLKSGELAELIVRFAKSDHIVEIKKLVRDYFSGFFDVPHVATV